MNIDDICNPSPFQNGQNPPDRNRPLTGIHRDHSLNLYAPQKLEGMVVRIRETENFLLKRSRENLHALKKILESKDDFRRVPAVLSAFSVAGIVAGLFINAGINYGCRLSYHSETLTVYLKQMLDEPQEQMSKLSALRHPKAGLQFPWFDGQIAAIQAYLEQFQQIQVRGIAPHLSFINKITEVTRALSEAPEGIASALRSYVTAPKEQLFIWMVVEELVACIDKYPECLESLHQAQRSAETQMTIFMQEVEAVLKEGRTPATAVTVTNNRRSTHVAEKLSASVVEQVDRIEGMRKSTERFDKFLQLMAKTLPPFIRTLSNLTIAWNRETKA